MPGANERRARRRAGSVETKRGGVWVCGSRSECVAVKETLHIYFSLQLHLLLTAAPHLLLTAAPSTSHCSSTSTSHCSSTSTSHCSSTYFSLQLHVYFSLQLHLLLTAAACLVVGVATVYFGEPCGPGSAEKTATAVVSWVKLRPPCAASILHVGEGEDASGVKDDNSAQ